MLFCITLDCLLFFSYTTSSLGGIEAKQMANGCRVAVRSESLERIPGIATQRHRRNSQSEVRSRAPKNIVPRNAKSMDRESGCARDSKYITSIDIKPVSGGRGSYSEMEDERLLEYEIYNARPGTVIPEPDENEVIYGVAPMPNNNVKIVLRKSGASEQRVDEPQQAKTVRQGSIVHINSKKHTVPYCCTGRNTRSNEIRIVVNHRYELLRTFY